MSTQRKVPEHDRTQSEITLVLEEHDLARILFQPGKLKLVYTSELEGTCRQEVINMPVYRVIGYCGPVHYDTEQENSQ